MTDEPHKLADDTDEAVADDAVSNRSDDTLLEEPPRRQHAGSDADGCCTDEQPLRMPTRRPRSTTQRVDDRIDGSR